MQGNDKKGNLKSFEKNCNKIKIVLSFIFIEILSFKDRRFYNAKK